MQSIASFILRIVLGFTFFVHGLDKFQGGLSNTADFFSSMGIPGLMAYIVAVIELVGGVAMVLGLGTRIIGALFTLVMLGAIVTVKFSAGFVGGYELDVALLAMSVYFILSSQSAFALDNRWKKA
ncbi:DoxX family protein [Rossellomorea marisflavi]|uniref:DoxX family protein n=1 Tax=Rossellomorea marisflavi TaxID=189381 RepID=UPI003458D6A8